MEQQLPRARAPVEAAVAAVAAVAPRLAWAARCGAAAPVSRQPVCRPAGPRQARREPRVFPRDVRGRPCRTRPRERPSSRAVYRWVFPAFPAVLAVGWSLPWLECFRYRLPNFPHSPACDGRERQRLHALLADGAKAAVLFRLIQLVDLCGDHQVRSAVILKPALEIQVLVHPSAAGIQYQAGKLQGFPFLQIFARSVLSIPPLGPEERGHSRTPVNRRNSTRHRSR